MMLFAVHYECVRDYELHHNGFYIQLQLPFVFPFQSLCLYISLLLMGKVLKYSPSDMEE